MNTGKFIIVSRDKSNNRCSMSAKPIEHNTESEAKAEAARLAQNNQDKEFTVLCVVATASVTKITWR